MSTEGAFYDVTAIFHQIFVKYASESQIEFISSIEIVLWLLDEDTYRRFYTELYDYIDPAPDQDPSCELTAVTVLTGEQAKYKTYFRKNKFEDVNIPEELLPGQEFTVFQCIPNGCLMAEYCRDACSCLASFFFFAF